MDNKEINKQEETAGTRLNAGEKGRHQRPQSNRKHGA